MTDDARLREEAAAWLARLRAPDGARDRARFEQWRGNSPAHAAAFRQVERHWEASKAIAASPIVAANRLRRPWWKVHVTPARLALASVAAIMLLWSAWSVSWQPIPGSPTVARTAIGEFRTFRLADGSQVTLDTDSAIAVRYTTGERGVALTRGRARFTVAHDPQRRFVVTAGKTLVVARGTVFDVDSRPGTIDVLLIEGAVDVIRKEARSDRRRVMLSAGHRITAVGETGRLSAISPAPAEAISWPSGMLTYHATTLDRVVGEANRYSRSKLVLAEPSLARLRVSGAFRASAQKELAASLASMFALRIEAAPNGSIWLVPTPETPGLAKGG